MGQIRIKTSKGWKKVVGNTASHYHQDEEPTEAVAGDIWMTDEDESTPFLQKIYDITFPVGSTKVCLNSSDIPVVPEGVTATWELDDTYNGKSLWVDNTQDVGTSLDGSLPNIEGDITDRNIYCHVGTGKTSGALTFTVGSAKAKQIGDTYGYYGGFKLDASQGNSVYSASAGENVVRPTSVTVKVYKRTA